MRLWTKQLWTQSIRLTASLIGISIWMTGSVSAQQTPWPQFRGPDANPTAENENLPTEWSTTKNVEWSTEVPGRGWSSPIVTGGKIFVTTATTDGESKPPQVGTNYSNEYIAEMMKAGLTEEEATEKVMERDFELPSEVTLHYLLVCLDLETGKQLWQREFHHGPPPGGRHRKNSFASETPTTDGKMVYVYIANLGLYAYDLGGNQVWTQKMESLPMYMEFGTGSSPILCDNRLIIVHDNEKQQFIAAYDKSNGEQIWRTDRFPLDKPPAGMPIASVPKSSWTTPYLWHTSVNGKERTEIITLSPGVTISYDLDGKELWRIRGTSIAPSASSFAYDGLLYLNGGRGRPIFAISPGATGDLTTSKDSDSNEHVVWERPRAGTYIPTPVAYRDGLYVVQDNGIFSRFDTKTGTQSFKARIKNSGADFTSSVWAYNGNVFCLSEQGDTYVFEAGEEYKLLHTNSLSDMTLSSPAIVGNRLLIRTEKRIYAISNLN